MDDLYQQRNHWDGAGIICIPSHYGLNFSFRQILHEGEFSKVTLVHDNVTGKDCVVKESDVNDYSKEEREVLVSLCDRIEYKHLIVQLLHCFCWRNNSFLVMEYMACGDLWDLMINRKIICGVEAARFYSAQVVLALEVLQNERILHRDIKAANVLVAANGYVKLGDFGFAKRLRNAKERATTLCGTLEYFGPERYAEECEYAYEVDMWALGVLFVEVGLGCVFLPEVEMEQVRAKSDMSKVLTADMLPRSLKSYCQFYPEKVFNRYKQDSCLTLADLFIKLLNPDQTKRLTAQQCKGHPFFAEGQQDYWKKLKAQSLEPPYKL